MNIKRFSALSLAVCLTLTICGCGKKDNAVFVQSVANVAGMSGIAPGDKFAGVVVSENVTEIQRDSEKTIEKLFVRAGDDVKIGQELFKYDTEELKLSLEKQQLQQDQLEATIENLTKQIEELTKEQARVSGRTKLEYTIEIQSSQIDLKESQLNLKTKKAEVASSEKMLKNATITSPVNGRVQSVNESDSDMNGNPLAYIVIQQAGSFRIKGTLNELQRGGLVEGDRLRILSRTDDQSWTGTVSRVDYENPSNGNQNNMYGNEPDQMTGSSKYPFYVELDSTDGLILGQHLYLMLDTGEEESVGLNIGSAFVCFDENESPYVWAENRGKLEKRAVTLGEFNEMRDTYQILSGITEEDYIAFPDAEACRPGVPTTRIAPQVNTGVSDADGAVDIGSGSGMIDNIDMGEDFGFDDFYDEDEDFEFDDDIDANTSAFFAIEGGV